MSETILVLVDGPNADNPACVWAAANAFPDSEILVGVSATAAHYDREAALGTLDIPESIRVQEDHTSRIAGMMGRAGMRNCVYIGLTPDKTDIVSVVPHKIHVAHDSYDIKGDAHGFGKTMIAGNFDDLLRRLAQSKGRILVVEGGPFSEVPHLIAHPQIAPRLGWLAAQAGFDLAERPAFSKLAFNVDVDMLAALKTLLWYPGPMVNVPSDKTRHPSVTYSGYRELLASGNIHPEIGEHFSLHRATAEHNHEVEQLRRKLEGLPLLKEYPPLSIHDLQAVLALRFVLGAEDPRLYTLADIDIETAVNNMMLVSQMREAEDGFRPAITPKVVKKLGYFGGNTVVRNGKEQAIAPRLVVAGQDAALYKGRVPQLLGLLSR